MTDCPHQVERWRIHKQIKEIEFKKTNIEFRLIIVDQHYEIIQKFKSKTNIPQSVLYAIEIGEKYLFEKRYNLASILFNLIEELYHLLLSKIEIRKEAKNSMCQCLKIRV